MNKTIEEHRKFLIDQYSLRGVYLTPEEKLLLKTVLEQVAKASREETAKDLKQLLKPIKSIPKRPNTRLVAHNQAVTLCIGLLTKRVK